MWTSGREGGNCGEIMKSAFSRADQRETEIPLKQWKVYKGYGYVRIADLFF